MRVLVISAVFPPTLAYGGVPPAVFGLAKALQEAGHTVQVVTTNADGHKALEVPSDVATSYQGVPVIYTRRWRRNGFYFSPTLGRCMGKIAPAFDIALVNGNWGYVNLAARLTLPPRGLPYVLYPQGIFDPWALHHGRWKKWLYWQMVEKRNYRQAGGVVAVTRREAEQVREHIPEVPVRVIPNGVDLDEFVPAPERAALQAVWPQLATSPFILFLSRLHSKKGLDVLFEAWAHFLEAARQPRWELPLLVVAGDGEASYEKELQILVHRFGLTERVIFTGPRWGRERLALLHHCEFMVLPSRGEGLPLAVLDALACGKPVLITPECYLPEVAQARAGLEVGLEAQAWALALAELWGNQEMKTQMGINARRLVQDRFTWQQVAEETASFCQEILDQRRGFQGES